MRLGVFISELRENELLHRLKAEKLGIFLVENGVYHAVIKEKGLLQKEGANYYCLLEDLKTRGFTDSDCNSKINVISYDDLVELIMNDYEKLIWL